MEKACLLGPENLGTCLPGGFPELLSLSLSGAVSFAGQKVGDETRDGPILTGPLLDDTQHTPETISASQGIFN